MSFLQITSKKSGFLTLSNKFTSILKEQIEMLLNKFEDAALFSLSYFKENSAGSTDSTILPSTRSFAG